MSLHVLGRWIQNGEPAGSFNKCHSYIGRMNVVSSSTIRNFSQDRRSTPGARRRSSLHSSHSPVSWSRSKRVLYRSVAYRYSTVIFSLGKTYDIDVDKEKDNTNTTQHNTTQHRQLHHYCNLQLTIDDSSPRHCRHL
jgi:hypothetical protein